MMRHLVSRRRFEAALLAGVLLMVLCAAGVSATSAPQVGSTAEESADPAMVVAAPANVSKFLDETRLPSLDSTAAASLRERMGAKGLLAVFADTKCPFAAIAVNELPGVASVYAAQGVKSVVVNINEAKEAVEGYYATKQLGMPVVYDTGKTTQAAWDITAVPTVFVIDTAGALVYRGNAVWADVGAAAEKGLKAPDGSLKVTPKGTAKG